MQTVMLTLRFSIRAVFRFMQTNAAVSFVLVRGGRQLTVIARTSDHPVGRSPGQCHLSGPGTDQRQF